MESGTPIYLDYNATTPIDPLVLYAMEPYMTEVFGNPASRHVFGREAREGVETARTQVSELINSDPKHIVFTSGATESNNLAIKSVAEMLRNRGNHIITSMIEHKSVIATCRRLEKSGFEVSWLRPDKYGLVSAGQVKEVITDKTILISIMFANNEVGTINPIEEIGKIARQYGVLFHSDATQALGKIPVNVKEMNVDLVSLSAHKVYAPKGTGCMYIGGKIHGKLLNAQIDGGGQERGIRSGTLNVPGIVGFGKACEIIKRNMPKETISLVKMRDRLHLGIAGNLDSIELNGHPDNRLCNTLNISFIGVESEALMMKMKNIAISPGSACTSDSLEPSHVLTAMGKSARIANSSLRFSLGRYTTQEEIDIVIEKVVKSVKELLSL